MFVFKTKNEKKDKPKPVELEFNSPINEQMVVRMLVLEEQVAKEPTNMKIIDELCQLYSVHPPY